MKLSKPCAFVLATAAAVASANAATVTLDPATLFGGGVAGTVVSGPAGFIPSSTTGALYGSLTGAPGYNLLTSSSPLLTGIAFTFCVELNEQAIIGSPNPFYTIVNPSMGYAGWGANAAGISTHVDKLMSLALPTIAAAAAQATLLNELAALQFAVWELIYDYSPSYTYNLGAGVFQGSSSAAVLAQANTWLAAPALSTAVPTAHYYVAQDPSHQDLLVAAVPEPASFGLVALALWVAGNLTKRRTRA
jgi:hypothetical protein